MATYLFGRAEWLHEQLDSAPTLAASVFFQMWRTRMDPYNRFGEGDTVYIGDQDRRRVVWEVRPTNVLTGFHYESTRHALAALRAGYGMYASDLNGYHRARSGHGWLLAWAPSVMRPLNISIPSGFAFGQNGYRPLTDVDVAALGLPRPKRGYPLSSPPPWYDPAAATTGRVTPVPRYIPIHVRREVVTRDGGRCVGCGVATNLHLDHILPWSHGGESTTENLRLLCARSNLGRGAGGTEDVPLCAARS